MTDALDDDDGRGKPAGIDSDIWEKATLVAMRPIKLGAYFHTNYITPLARAIQEERNRGAREGGDKRTVRGGIRMTKGRAAAVSILFIAALALASVRQYDLAELAALFVIVLS